ncbi:MAG: exonuclease SbcCD subunit D [Acidobacteria bacterium]|jgi:DNA repair exonuclease SbcCD nuclease subunit|nr:MAG: exonuclease SbcCD subunit D [Acidobacteriota bacterium]GIU81069.1 MAG: DNA repair protein [Pyrinomonadaceae bacterium]
MKFLHIADVHLGCNRYGLAESERDFWYAWSDFLMKYAVGERVDFVLIAGDFLHKQDISPETANYAYVGLSYLKNNGIPVVVVEGNHDRRKPDARTSWLKTLANWGLIHLLEPTVKEENGRYFVTYEEWNREEKCGGYIDIGNARIFGSTWYGNTINQNFPLLLEALEKSYRPDAFNILAIHTDIEGYEKGHIPGLSRSLLGKARKLIDYVAIGHPHKYYSIDNWIFCPGSLEITNIADYKEERGGFLVEVNEDKTFQVTHLKDYKHRPFERLELKISDCATPEQVLELLERFLDEQNIKDKHSQIRPIVELTLTGFLRFAGSSLESSKIRKMVQEKTNAYHVRFRNNAIPEKGEEIIAEQNLSRADLERRIVRSLVLRDSRYKKDEQMIEDITSAIIGSKQMALNEEEPEKIFNFIASKVLRDV